MDFVQELHYQRLKRVFSSKAFTQLFMDRKDEKLTRVEFERRLDALLDEAERLDTQ